MDFFKNSRLKFRNLKFTNGSVLVGLALLAIGSYAIRQSNAHSSGITGTTEKNTESGCYCHCSTPSNNTTVTITTSATTFVAGQTYQFTASVSNSGESEAGIDIATEYGTLDTVGGDGLYSSNGELTHSSPKSLTATWTFKWTAPSNSASDTIFATGNAVNGDGKDDCLDEWNHSSKYIIHISTVKRRIAFNPTSISFGQVRVGRRAASPITVSSTGDSSITISSSSMKSGIYFSSYPSSSNRAIAQGSTETDSAIFTPTARGSVNDSIVYHTNSDTAPEQQTGVYVSGQGIQAVFNSPNGTTLAFGNLHANRTAQMTFNFSNSGDDTLFLSTPTISGTGFSIQTGPSTLTYPPNASGSVVVKFAPTQKTSYNGSLVFSASNSVSAPTVTLSGAGILPQIQIASSSSLGSMRVGQTLSGSISFKNVGNDTLHISSATLTQLSSKFSLTGNTQSIPPNDSGIFSISYTPTAEMTDTGTLHFITDDPSDSIASVAVSASGTLPHMFVSLSTDTVNVGTVKINSTGTANISVQNNGGATLNLSGNSAGPAPFALSAVPTTISAGSSSNITVAFSPTSVGTFTGSLIIHGDDAKNPTDTVYLKGAGVNSALSISPGSVNFDSVPIHATVQRTITLSDSGQANVTIYSSQISPINGLFAFVGATPTQVPAGGTAQITVSFTPDSAGNFSGTVTLTTDDANAPTRTIALNGTGINDPFSVTPTTFNFGQVRVSTLVNDSIMMTNTGTSAVTILSYKLSAPDGGFSITDSSAHSVASGATAKVEIGFDPANATNYSGTLTITTNDVSDPVRTISLSGSGVKGSLTINPFPITFGYVTVGHDSSMHAELRNAGLASVTINSANIVGPTASVFNDGTLSTPLTLAAGDSTSLQLSFTPSNAGNYFDTLRFLLSDGSTVDAPISGSAVNSGVSLYEAPPFAMLLSPNPAGNSVAIHLSVQRSTEFTVDLFDASGGLAVHSAEGMLGVGDHDLPIAIQSLAEGTYFVRVRSAEGRETEALLVVQRK